MRESGITPLATGQRPCRVRGPKGPQSSAAVVMLLKAGIAISLAVVSGGCQVGRQWFRMDSDSRTPSMGVELRAEQSRPPADRPIAESSPAPPPVETASLPQPSEDRPTRRLIPDWLRLGKGEEPVPLPTTQPLDPATPADSVAGPVEEFQ